MQMRIIVCNFALRLEIHSVYYLNETQLLCAYASLTTGLNKFHHTSVQMGIACIKCVLEDLSKTNS